MGRPSNTGAEVLFSDRWSAEELEHLSGLLERLAGGDALRLPEV